MTLFFSSLGLVSLVSSSSFFSFSFRTRWLLLLLFFLFPFTGVFFSSSFTRFGEFGFLRFFFSLGSVNLGFRGWREKKKVKAAPSYRYGTHKQLKILSDCAKWVACRELGYFKWWLMNDENWIMSDKWLFFNQTSP